MSPGPSPFLVVLKFMPQRVNLWQIKINFLGVFLGGGLLFTFTGFLTPGPGPFLFPPPPPDLCQVHCQWWEPYWTGSAHFLWSVCRNVHPVRLQKQSCTTICCCSSAELESDKLFGLVKHVTIKNTNAVGTWYRRMYTGP